MAKPRGRLNENVPTYLETIHENLNTLQTKQDKFQKDIRSLANGQESLQKQIEVLRTGQEKLQHENKKLQVSLDNAHAREVNKAAYKAWDGIWPIAMDGKYPEYFPAKLIKFWHLQSPKNHVKLRNLIRFYKLDNRMLYYYSRETHSLIVEEYLNSPSRQIKEEPTNIDEPFSDSDLLAIIKAGPLFILRVLADELRLDFQRIRSNMPELSPTLPSVTNKRGMEVDARTSETHKKTKTRSSVEQDAPTDTRFDSNTSFFRALVRDPEEPITESPESSEGHITWDRPNLTERKPRTPLQILSSPQTHRSSEEKPTSTLQISTPSPRGDFGDSDRRQPLPTTPTTPTPQTSDRTRKT